MKSAETRNHSSSSSKKKHDSYASNHRLWKRSTNEFWKSYFNSFETDLFLRNTKGGGNCFFHALSDGLKHAFDISISHLDIRKLAAAELQQDMLQDTLLPIIEHDEREAKCKEWLKANGNGLESVKEMIRRPNLFWGNDFIISLLDKSKDLLSDGLMMKNVGLIILHEEGFIHNLEMSSAKSVYILMFLKGGYHFELAGISSNEDETFFCGFSDQNLPDCISDLFV